jgi:hypothetical protein
MTDQVLQVIVVSDRDSNYYIPSGSSTNSIIQENQENQENNQEMYDIENVNPTLSHATMIDVNINDQISAHNNYTREINQILTESIINLRSTTVFLHEKFSYIYMHITILYILSILFIFFSVYYK